MLAPWSKSIHTFLRSFNWREKKFRTNLLIFFVLSTVVQSNKAFKSGSSVTHLFIQSFLAFWGKKTADLWIYGVSFFQKALASLQKHLTNKSIDSRKQTKNDKQNKRGVGKSSWQWKSRSQRNSRKLPILQSFLCLLDILHPASRSTRPVFLFFFFFTKRLTRTWRYLLYSSLTSV